MNIFSLTGIERLHEDEANVDFVSKRRITRHQVGFYTTLEAAEAIETSGVRARQKGLRGGDGVVVNEHSFRSKTCASRIASNGD